MCRADIGPGLCIACFGGESIPAAMPVSGVVWRAGREAALTDRFVSNFTNRLDAKGRVSIPAGFRAVLARDGYEGLYVHPALDLSAIDAGGHALRRSIDEMLARFSPFSDEWELLSTALNGASEVLKVDPEGRIVLGEALKAHAGIGDTVTFVGHGHKFQLWEPERFQAHLAMARTRLREVRRSLGMTAPGGEGVS